MKFKIKLFFVSLLFSINLQIDCAEKKDDSKDKSEQVFKCAAIRQILSKNKDFFIENLNNTTPFPRALILIIHDYLLDTKSDDVAINRISCFSQDHKYLACTTEQSKDQNINLKVFDYFGYRSFALKTTGPIAFLCDNNVLASFYDNPYAADRRYLEIWDLSLNQCIKTLRGFPTYIESMACSPKSKEIAICCYNTNKIQVRNIDTDNNRELIDNQAYSCYMPLYSEDGNFLFCCFADTSGRISIWDLRDCINTPKISLRHGVARGVRQIALDCSGKYLASLCCDETAKIWDWNESTCLKTVNLHCKKIAPEFINYEVRSFAYSKDRKYMAFASNKEVQLMDLEQMDKESSDNKQYTAQKILIARVYKLIFTPDGKFLILNCEDGVVKLIQLQENHAKKNIC